MYYSESAIGGYLSLELNSGKSLYHDDCIAVNTGRNAFEVLLSQHKPAQIFIPYYTCDALLEPLEKLSIKYQFYHIDKSFRPILKDFPTDAALLYTNYFGLCGSIVQELFNAGYALFVDSAQSFYSKPLKGAHTFYSPRKFFGVPDGGFCTSSTQDLHYPKDYSFERMKHLLIRLDYGAEMGFPDYQENESKLCNQEVKEMSAITTALLCAIDFESVREKRLRNFALIHERLGKSNELFDVVRLDQYEVPLCYPYLVPNGADLRERLIQHRVYVPQYWKNVLNWVSQDTFEFYLTKNLVCLPIEQKLTESDIERMCTILEV